MKRDLLIGTSNGGSKPHPGSSSSQSGGVPFRKRCWTVAGDYLSPEGPIIRAASSKSEATDRQLVWSTIFSASLSFSTGNRRMGWHALDSRHRPPDNAALQRGHPFAVSVLSVSLSPLPSVPLRIVAPDSCLALPSRLPSGLDFLSRSLYTIVTLFCFLTPFSDSDAMPLYYLVSFTLSEISCSCCSVSPHNCDEAHVLHPSIHPLARLGEDGHQL